MLKSINQEEIYLDWDPSDYPLLQKINLSVERYSSLWHTALDFHENYEKWYYGPFLGLDTETIQTQVFLHSIVFKTIHNLNFKNQIRTF